MSTYSGIQIRRPGFVAFLFVPGTARFSRGVSFAFKGFCFSLNPRGLIVWAFGRVWGGAWWAVRRAN